jgi:TetR/AcrR family transcriptional regulator, regulator of autoinduction and epiphytic fitness
MAENAATTKPPRKRRYTEKPDIRANLLDAAESLIREEGYGAATARRIAERVGMKHQAVFYYFGSQDELLVEVFRRGAKAQRDRLEVALNSGKPIRAMWEIHRDPDVTKFVLEFMALANHNEAIRAEIAANAEVVRKLESDAVERHLKERGIEPRLSPQLVSVLTNGLARLLVQEANLGIIIGHEEAEALVSASMSSFEAQGNTTTGVAPIVDAMSTPDQSA